MPGSGMLSPTRRTFGALISSLMFNSFSSLRRPDGSLLSRAPAGLGPAGLGAPAGLFPDGLGPLKCGLKGVAIKNPPKLS